MYNYNILEKKHKEFQYNLELAKSNLKKAEQSEALNFPDRKSTRLNSSH